MENDVYDLTPKEKPDSSSYKKKIEISYYQARFTQKCGAILLDFVIFAFLALALFIGAKGIVEATPYFQEVNQKYDEARLDSYLYVENKDIGRIEDVVTYLNRKTNMSTSEKETFLYDRINGFLVSVPEKTDYLTDEFYDFVLDEDLKYNGESYYIKDENGELIKNSAETIPSQAYFENVLVPYFDNIALAEFTIITPNVLDYQRYQSNMLLFVEIPSGIILSTIIVRYIIPIIFFRGKKSLGRLAFRIGLLGKDNFSLTIGRFTLRFLIFLFAEVILSVFTLCVPLIISISMSAFTKKKQNFHDFMLDIKEVDTYGTKIYLDKYDILKEENKHEPIDFISR